MKNAIIALMCLALTMTLTPGCNRGNEVTATINTILSDTVATVDLIPLSQIQETASEPDPDGAQLLMVNFSANGGYIDVQFTAPYELTQNWWQGSIYVSDESTGMLYYQIPVMPVVGPLMGKPRYFGQKGYCMLVNQAPWLAPGSLITVVLGNYKRLHVIITNQ